MKPKMHTFAYRLLAIAALWPAVTLGQAPAAAEAKPEPAAEAKPAAAAAAPAAATGPSSTARRARTRA